MAHKKGKGDKTTGSDGSNDGSALILDYLRKQNRPYSAIDVSLNLHNKVTKTYAAKALRELHQNKEIEGRATGKQTVYHALQDSTDDVTPEVLAGLDQEIKQLQNELATLKANEKATRAALTTLCARPMLSGLRQDINRLGKEKEVILARLAKLRGNGSVHMSREERINVEKEWKIWQKCVGIRKRICRDIWSKCSEVVSNDITRDELWESLGLEGDLKL